MDRQALFERILILFAVLLATLLIVINVLSAPDGRSIRVYVQQPAVVERQAPSEPEPATSPAPTERSAEALSAGAVDLNAATVEELMTLEGIGPVRAQAIVEYRETYGPFRSVEELTLVPGIGEGTLEKLRTRLCV